MNDKPIIIAGLIIFLAIFTFPFWYNLGNATTVPEPILSAKAKAAGECVAEKSYMVPEHMQLLNDWREKVVRGGDRIYKNSKGKTFAMSLSTGEDSCIGCHVSKRDFCDKCHTYASVRPYCWDCHIEPKETK